MKAKFHCQIFNVMVHSVGNFVVSGMMRLAGSETNHRRALLDMSSTNVREAIGPIGPNVLAIAQL